MSLFDKWVRSPDWMALVRSTNGRERERAVRELHRLGRPDAIPELLQRANDWVPQVRDAARIALTALLADAHVESWMQALPAIEALRRGARADHGLLLQAIDDFLRRPANLAHLSARVDGLPRVAQRRVFFLRLDEAADDTALQALLLQALGSGDLVVARRSMGAMHRVSGRAACDGLLRAACASSHVAVRVDALRWLRAHPDDNAMDLLRALCLDTSPTVREGALEATKADRGAVLERARRHLDDDTSSPKVRAAALQVLCALREPDAMAACARLAEDDSAQLRRSAYAGMFRLLPQGEHIGWMLRTLADVSPKVQRLAVLQVRRGTAPPEMAALADLARRRGAWRAVLRVLPATPPWARLGFVLAGLEESRELPDRVALLHEHLADWCDDMGSCFLAARPGEAAELRLRWGRLRNELPGELRERVQFILDTFGVAKADA